MLRIPLDTSRHDRVGGRATKGEAASTTLGYMPVFAAARAHTDITCVRIRLLLHQAKEEHSDNRNGSFQLRQARQVEHWKIKWKKK